MVKRVNEILKAINLTFHTTFTRTSWIEWAYLLPIGSDHEAISFTAYFIELQYQERPDRGYNCRKANRLAFEKHIQASIGPVL